MKKTTLTTLVLIVTMITAVASVKAQEVNMNRYITLNVKKGKRIEIQLRAMKENTKLKIFTGIYTNILVGTQWKSYKYTVTKGSTIIIYGDVAELNCGNNNENLTALDISQNTALTELSCHKNNLTSLDVSNNTNLLRLLCYGNNLTSLDVSNNTELRELYCYSNNLKFLNVSKNTALEFLDCHNNNLTSLDVSKSTALEYLECYNNNLTSLDVSNNTNLLELNCFGNILSACALNDLFRSLPKRDGGNKGTVYIKRSKDAHHNPGVDGCLTPIAYLKNWKVMDHDWNWKNGEWEDNSIEIHNTSFTCTDYGFRILGTAINSENYGYIDHMDGVTPSGGVNYYPNTNTLELYGGKILSTEDQVDAFQNFDNDGMTIDVGYTCDIGVEQGTDYAAGMYIQSHTTIDGRGTGYDTLYCYSGGGSAIYIRSGATLTVRGGVVVRTWDVSGSGDGGLSVDNATLETFSWGSIEGIASLTLKGCRITKPAGARFDKGKKAIVDAKGNVAKGVKIEPRTNALPATLTDAGISLRGERGVLYVEKSPEATATQVAVYDISGMSLGNYPLNAQTTAIHLPAGFYTVVAGNAVNKVIVR